MGVQRKIFVALMLAAALQVVHYYPLLPFRVASHFDASGKADNWMPKEGFVLLYVMVMSMMATIFVGVPKLMAKTPDSMINLPNKGYWLAPERRARTFETIEIYMIAGGNATIGFMLGVFQLAFSANLGAGNQLSISIWPLLLAFVLLMIAWTIRFIRAFRLPRDPSTPLS